jgi:uracil phosphoribosyltransferase
MSILPQGVRLLRKPKFISQFLCHHHSKANKTSLLRRPRYDSLLHKQSYFSTVSSSNTNPTRFHDPTSRTNIYTAILGGILAGSVFVSGFEYVAWDGEFDDISFRIPGEEQLDTNASDITVYETTSGVPEGVLGDIWKAMNPNVTILEETSEPIQRMLAQVRDRNTSGAKFVFYANRLWMLLLEQALCEIDEMEDYLIVTPSGHRYKGSFLSEDVKLCGISLQTNVVEANTQALNSLLLSLQSLLNAEGCNLSQFGEVVVKKEDTTSSTSNTSSSRRTTTTATNTFVGTAKVSKSVLPSDIEDRYALIVHPTLSTGTSAMVAVEHLVNEKKVPEDHIMVLVLLACPESIEAMNNAFPNVKIVSAALDSHLDSDTKRIVPGLGDFGARYAYKVDGTCNEDIEDNDERLRKYQDNLYLKHHNSHLGLQLNTLKKRKTRRVLANRRKSARN